MRDDPLEQALAQLADKIAAGETIDVSELPEELATRPEVAHLLRFGRVAQALADNVGAAPTASSAPERIGPWRVLRLLGSGGMGDVWLGERADGTVEHRVAIKRVRGPSFAFTQRLEAERRILARLSHPNIARFIDAGVDTGGAPWLALEYIEGIGLGDWLERERPSLRARLNVFLAICEAVDHAHRHLVVHRDLKPANVLVDAQGVPRLLDFGIAKLMDGPGGETTHGGMTPAYAAPEQLRGGEVSTATDVYALGLLLFRMLVGDLPETRRDASLAAMLGRLDQEETQRPSRHPAPGPALPYSLSVLRGDLDAMVSRALRARPEDRYATARELAADLQRHLDGRPVEARPPTGWYLASRFARRHRGALSVALAAGLGILISLGLALWQAQRAGVAAQQAREQAARADAQAHRARAQAQRAEDAARFLVSVFRQIDPFRRDPRGKISLEQAFEDALARVDREFADRPQLAIDLNDDFGETLINLGRFDEARQRLAQARALAEANLAADDPRLAEILLNQARLMARTGQGPSARAEVERALAVLRPRADSEPVRLAQAQFSLAEILLDLNQADAAEPLVREGLALIQRHLPDHDPRQAEAVFSLAQLLRHQRRDDEARPLIDEAVRRAEALQGAESATLIEFLDAMRGNGNALMDPKRERAAVDRMLAVAQRNFPGDHPLHARGLIAVGTILLRDHGDDRGEAMLRDAAGMLRRLDHPDEARAWRMIGWTRNFWERYGLALAALEEGHTRCLSKDPAFAECLAIAAERVNSLVRLGRGAEAIAASAQLDAVIAAHGALGMDTREMAAEARAEAYVAGNRHADAIAVYDELIATYGKRYGADSSIVENLRQRREQIAAALAP